MLQFSISMGHCSWLMLILSYTLFSKNLKLCKFQCVKHAKIMISYLYELKNHLPQATLAFGSCFKWASNTASLIWSHILSKWEQKENKKIIFWLFRVQTDSNEDKNTTKCRMILQFLDSTMPWFKINGQTNSFQSLDFYTKRRAKFCRMTVSSLKLCFFFELKWPCNIQNSISHYQSARNHFCFQELITALKNSRTFSNYVCVLFSRRLARAQLAIVHSWCFSIFDFTISRFCFF